MDTIVLSGQTINKAKQRAIVRNEIFNMHLNADESLILAKSIRGVEYKKVKNNVTADNKSVNSVDQALEILDNTYVDPMILNNLSNDEIIEKQNEYNKQLSQLKLHYESLLNKQDNYNTKLDKLEQDRILTNQYYEKQVKIIEDCDSKYDKLEQHYSEKYEQLLHSLHNKEEEFENLRTQHQGLEEIIKQQAETIEYIQQENARVLLFLAELLNSPA